METQKKGSCIKRPGVMIYFDMVEPIRELRDSDKGRILMAILEYGMNGTEPQFSGMANLAWGFIKPRLDRDAQTYDNIKYQRKYAAFCRETAKRKLPKVPFETWHCMTEEARQSMLSGDISLHRADDFDASRYPDTDTAPTADTEETANTKTVTNRNRISSASAAADGNTDSGLAAAAAERKLKKMYGELGQGVVNLSEYHIDRLLDQMGLEMFDYYVKKLSDFILKNGASVKNHYGTILRWWQEDNQC